MPDALIVVKVTSFVGSSKGLDFIATDAVALIWIQTVESAGTNIPDDLGVPVVELTSDTFKISVPDTVAANGAIGLFILTPTFLFLIDWRFQIRSELF